MILAIFEDAKWHLRRLFYEYNAVVYANHPQYDAYVTIDVRYFKTFSVKLTNIKIPMIDGDLDMNALGQLLRKVDHVKILYKFDSKYDW